MVRPCHCEVRRLTIGATVKWTTLNIDFSFLHGDWRRVAKLVWNIATYCFHLTVVVQSTTIATMHSVYSCGSIKDTGTCIDCCYSNWSQHSQVSGVVPCRCGLAREVAGHNLFSLHLKTHVQFTVACTGKQVKWRLATTISILPVPFWRKEWAISPFLSSPTHPDPSFPLLFIKGKDHMPPLTLLPIWTRRMVLVSRAHRLLPTATQPLLGSIYHPYHIRLWAVQPLLAFITPPLPPVPIPHELINSLLNKHCNT